jgi:L-lactate dehydrogenase complex protein LldG
VSAREEILERIRQRVDPRADVPDRDYAAIERRYQQAGTLSADRRIELLASRLGDYGVEVYRATLGVLPSVVADALAHRRKRRMLLAPDVPRDWLPDACVFQADDGLGPAELDRSEGVLTGCTLAIALTGTIVLCHSHSEGRRTLTLVPDYHLCVIGTDQVVETVPEGIRRCRDLGAKLITTISGPSATADIEMTRVKGVHGPRTLDVILFDR